jgi:hypothetical protein
LIEAVFITTAGTDKNGSFLMLARDQDSVHFPSSLTPSRELEQTELLVLISTVLPRDAQWRISEVKQTEDSRLNALQDLLVGARCSWRSWLKHWATSRKVASSISYGVTGIFH